MTTLTITLAGSAVVSGSKVYTMTDADLQRVLNVMKARYQTVDVTGKVIVLTNQQILLAWVQGWIAETMDAVRAAEAAAVVPPTLT
jgi:hypothetical protein